MTTSFLDFIIMFLGVVAMYSPWIQLKKEEGITGNELSREYPHHSWMRWGFIVLYLSWTGLVFYFFYNAISFSWMEHVSFIGGIFASIGLFIGLFAVITSVTILPMRVPIIKFVVGDKARRAGIFQTTWSLCVIFIVILMHLF